MFVIKKKSSIRSYLFKFGKFFVPNFYKSTSYPQQNTCWNVSIYWDNNDSLKRVVYCAKFFCHKIRSNTAGGIVLSSDLVYNNIYNYIK